MAQLKDTVITGSLQVTDSILSNSAQFQILRAPTSAGGTAYGAGTNGQVLQSDGTNTYWGNLAISNISGTLGISQGGTNATTIPAARTNLGIGNEKVFYGTCSTLANVATKIVECTEFNPTVDLTVGTIISVLFSVKNTAAVADLTLSIGNSSNGYSTAVAIKQIYNTGGITNLTSASQLPANGIITFVYTGSYWQVIGLNYNNTYTLTEVYCNTAADTAAKTSSNASYYYIGDGTTSIKYHHFEITMRYSNTAQDTLTLNINGQGAKPIYINGTVSSANNYTLPRGKYIVYYDGTNYYFRTDGKLTANITGSANNILQQYTADTVTSADYRVLFTETSGINGTSDVTASTRLSNLLHFNPNTGRLTATSVANAIWNDYAEYRTTLSNVKPGQVVADNDNGSLYITNKRLIPGAQVVSDTWGHIMGETDEAKTPLAVAGRVLAYTHRPREEYHAGMAVCSAPGGTVDIMTREEIRNYPDAIIGIVSEIPDYEEWGTGKVKVNGRIWIKVK